MRGERTQRIVRAVAILAFVASTFSYAWSRCQAMADDTHWCCEETVVNIACCSISAQDLSTVQTQKDVPQKLSFKTANLFVAIPLTAFPMRPGRLPHSGHFTGPPSLFARPAFIVFGAFLG